MDKGLFISTQGIKPQARNIEIIANNLANLNTTGYKRAIPFSEYLSKFDDKEKKQMTDFSEGTFVETGNTFDLALSGEAFFMVKDDDGIKLTKNGQFTLSDEGYLVNQDGSKVLSGRGEINLFESVLEQNKGVSISKSGEIKVGDLVVDQLLIAEIEKHDKVKRAEGQNFEVPEDDYEIADEDNYTVYQGFLEESNTNAIMEMQAMIKTNKNYETAQKIVNAFDEKLSKAKEIGKV